MEIETWHCPRCSTLLHKMGEVQEGDACHPVFQCDDCVVEKDFCGEMFEMALTFVVKDGIPVGEED